MIYQDRLETNLLQLFTHTQSSEWFNIISVISFDGRIQPVILRGAISAIFGSQGSLSNGFELVVRQNHWHLPIPGNCE